MRKQYRIVERRINDKSSFEPQVRFALFFWSGYDTFPRLPTHGMISSRPLRFDSFMKAREFIESKATLNTTKNKTIIHNLPY